jgi:hypothetical protein
VRASYLCGQMPGTTTSRRLRLGPIVREPETAVKANVGLVRVCWIAPGIGIVSVNQSLYKLEKQSG